MVFSGVAGSRPARELCLADGYGKGTVKGPRAFSSESLPAPDAGWVPVRVKKTRQNKEKGPDSEPVGGYDNASISASLRSPETIMIGIGNEPTAWAIAVISGAGTFRPGIGRQHQHRDVGILVDDVEDLLGRVALADHPLRRDRGDAVGAAGGAVEG